MLFIGLILTSSPPLKKRFINETIDEDKIRKVAFKKYNSLLNDGEEKVKKGITSELEIKRVLKQVD